MVELEKVAEKLKRFPEMMSTEILRRLQAPMKIPENLAPKYKQLFTPAFRNLLSRELLTLSDNITKTEYLERWRTHARSGLQIEKWVAANNKNWAGVRLMHTIHYSAKDEAEFARLLNTKMPMLLKIDPELGAKIEEIRKSARLDPSEFEALLELRAICKDKDAERAEKHFKERFALYYDKVAAFGGKFGEVIIRILATIQKMERENKQRLQFLDGSIRSVESWDIPASANIDDFRVSYYQPIISLFGQLERFCGKDLRNKLEKEPEVINFMNYEEEYAYCFSPRPVRLKDGKTYIPETMATFIAEATRSGDWNKFFKEFLGKDGRKIKAEEHDIEKEFHDRELRLALVAFYREYREQVGGEIRPGVFVGWAKGIRFLDLWLRRAHFRRVVTAMRNKLIAVLNEEEAKLKEKEMRKIREALAELKGLVAKRIGIMKKGVRRIWAIVEEKRKLLRVEWKKTRVEFRRMEEQEIVPAVLDERTGLEPFMTQLLSDDIYGMVARLHVIDELMHKSTNYVASNVRKVDDSKPMQSIPYLFYASFALSSLDRLNSVMNENEQKALDTVTRLYRLLPGANKRYNTLILKLKKLLSYLFQQGFKLEIKDL